MMQAYSHHYRDTGQKAKPKPAMISIRLTEYNKLKRDNAALVEALKELVIDIEKTFVVFGVGHMASEAKTILKAKAALEAAQKEGE